jgi:hypothetical protein
MDSRRSFHLAAFVAVSMDLTSVWGAGILFRLLHICILRVTV